MAKICMFLVLVVYPQMCGLVAPATISDNTMDLANIVKQMTHMEAEIHLTMTDLQATKNDLETSKTELRLTKTQLLATKSELQTTQSLLNTTISRMTSVQSELQSTKSELHTTSKMLNDTALELRSTQSELQSTQSELQGTKRDLKDQGDRISSNVTSLRDQLYSKTQDVSFYAYMTGRTHTGSSTPLKFDSVGRNTASCYRSNTGKFTAPVSGTYLFMVNFELWGQSAHKVTYIKIVQSGITISGSYGETGKDLDDITIPVMAIPYLTRGEQVWVESENDVYTDNKYRSTHFTGALLSAV